MKSSFFQRLARRGKDSETDAAAALADIENDLAIAKAALVDLETRYGDRVVAAADEAAIEVIEAEIGARRRDVERLTAAHAAVSSRLIALQAASAKRRTVDQWAEAERALDAQRAALRRFDDAAKAVALAAIDAEEAARKAHAAMPVRDLAGRPLMVAFGHLGRELDLLLSLHSSGRVGSVANSALWELERMPSLHERFEKSAAWWLSPREAPQEAA